MSKTFAIVGAGPGGLNITHSEPLDVFWGATAKAARAALELVLSKIGE